MCEAMIRPATNVLFSAFGKVDAAATGSVKSVQADEAALLLAMAGRVVIGPTMSRRHSIRCGSLRMSSPREAWKSALPSIL